MELDKRLVMPDYKNCLANIPNSVLKHFGVPTVGDTLPQLDRLLAEKDYKNVVLMLLDGMGTYVMEETLEEGGFLRSHFTESIKSVFLATTVAATTSAISGLQPCEHSWLGWDCYYPSVDKNVTVFLNTVQGTYDPAAPYNIARTVTPYESVVEKINKAGGRAYESFPFSSPFPGTIERICDRVRDLCAKDGKKYIYAYWSEPDTTLHKRGRRTKEVKQTLTEIEAYIEKTAAQLKDTLLIITADHGHINNRLAFLDKYPEICDCLVRTPSLEPRVLNLFVKPGREAEFEERFNAAFGEDFILLPTERALEMQLFGTGAEHREFRSMLGDYLAIAAGDLSIYFTNERWKAMHGSLTPDEMLIPLIVIKC